MAKENRGSNKSDDSKKASALRLSDQKARSAKPFALGQKTPHMDGRGQSGKPKGR
jgi:hypothetical protein